MTDLRTCSSITADGQGCIIDTQQPIVGMKTDVFDCEKSPKGFLCGGDEYLLSDDKKHLIAPIWESPYSVRLQLGSSDESLRFIDMAMDEVEKLDNHGYARQENYLRIIRTAIDIKLFDKARVIIEKIEDSKSKSQLLCDVALAERNEAVIAASKNKPSVSLPWSDLAYMAKIKGDKELFNKAVAAVSELHDSWEKAGAFLDLAKQSGDAAIFDKALNTARKMEDAMLRAQMLFDMAIEKKDPELFKEAMSATRRIRGREARSQILADKGVLALKKGYPELFDKVVPMVRRIDGMWNKIWLQLEIAKKSGNKEMFDEVAQKATSEAIKAFNDRKMEMYELLALAKMTDSEALFAKAIHAAHDLEGTEKKVETLLDIARAKKDPNVLVLIRSILPEKEYPNPFIFHRIIYAAVELGAIEEAIALIKTMDLRRRVESFCYLADITGNRIFYDVAISEAEGADDSRRDFAFLRIVEMQARSGLFDEAASTYRKIHKEELKAGAFAAISREMAAKGMFDQSFGFANSIGDSRYKISTFLYLATRIKDVGFFRYKIPAKK